MRRYFALVDFEPGCAYGIRFPDLPNVIGASDEAEDIITNAMDALQAHAFDEDLPDPMTYEQVTALPDVRDALSKGCYLIQVPFIREESKVLRLNISMEQGLVRAIDTAATRRGLTRSAFLATAARHEIETAG